MLALALTSGSNKRRLNGERAVDHLTMLHIFGIQDYRTSHSGAGNDQAVVEAVAVPFPSAAIAAALLADSSPE